MRLEASIVFDILYLFGQEKIIFHEILGNFEKLFTWQPWQRERH